jgi:hypothetical protein
MEKLINIFPTLLRNQGAGCELEFTFKMYLDKIRKTEYSSLGIFFFFFADNQNLEMSSFSIALL